MQESVLPNTIANNYFSDYSH